MASAQFQLSAHAQRDLFKILAHSRRRFGEKSATRYNHLLFTAFETIADDPRLLSSRELLDMRIYHLRHCRRKASMNGLIVKAPRHFVLYRIKDLGGIEILRLLHDEMDIDQQAKEINS